jgi:molybdopterin/thiamine biosynthesis adenylyltransferase
MRTRHIVAAGAGGNTGSHLLPHLARMSEVARLTLVDPDAYEAGNLAVQNIESLDIGQPKVLAQTGKLRRINPSLELVALQERIEDVPRGLLQCDLIVSCLDGRAARQAVNEIAWRLNTPWIDCGILGSQNLARVNAYVPAQDAPCLECPWSREDYALVEQEYLCGAGSGSAYPTMASSALGALAAALMAIEIAKFLGGDLTASVCAKQVLVDAQHHLLRVTAGRRNPDCLFDHRTWVIEPWNCQPEATTVADAMRALGSLQVEGHRFVRELACPGCGCREESLRLNRPLARCPVCDRRMVPPGFGSLERLDSELASDEYESLTLAQIGLRAGDIVSNESRHYRITEPEHTQIGPAWRDGNPAEAA